MSANFFLFNIFTDDVRQEIGGKLSFIGVYQGGLSIDEDDIKKPKQLSVVCSLFIPTNAEFTSIRFKIFWERGDVLSEEKVPPELVAEVKKQVADAPKNRGMAMQAVFNLDPHILVDDFLWANVYIDDLLIPGNPLEVKIEKSEIK